jgi:pimeloyl-ACP methyl ester carboxylesterase
MFCTGVSSSDAASRLPAHRVWASGSTRFAGAAAAQAGGRVPMDAKSEAKKIAFDRTGKGDKVLLISGFPQTRRSWDRLIPLLSQKFETIPADLPSFGDSGILSAPSTTENAGRIFHQFAAGLGTPLHVVAHDFGAWVAYSWALLFKDDFRSLTLIDAGIPGVTLLNEIELSDYKRKWNFIFQMLPDLPAELTKGKEDVYVGWWFNIGIIEGGSFECERLSGEVLGGGNDWQAVRKDGCTKLDVRIVLRTTDSALIVLTYQALRHGPAEVMEKLDKGEHVDPTSYYFRMNPLFETGAEEYDW